MERDFDAEMASLKAREREARVAFVKAKRNLAHFKTLGIKSHYVYEYVMGFLDGKRYFHLYVSFSARIIDWRNEVKSLLILQEDLERERRGEKKVLFGGKNPWLNK